MPIAKKDIQLPAQAIITVCSDAAERSSTHAPSHLCVTSCTGLMQSPDLNLHTVKALRVWLPLHNQLYMKQPRKSLQAPAIAQSILLSSQQLPTLQAQLTN